jgi:hypothetical protein
LGFTASFKVFSPFVRKGVLATSIGEEAKILSSGGSTGMASRDIFSPLESFSFLLGVDVPASSCVIQIILGKKHRGERERRETRIYQGG